MSTYSLLLHVIHIGCALFWGGTILFLHFYVLPAVKGAGPDGGKIMQAIISTRKMPVVLTTIGFTTIIAGLLLLEYVSAGFTSTWFGSRMGITLSIGGTLGLTALLIGFFYNKPAADKVAKISAALATSGTPPNPEQLAVINDSRVRIIRGTKLMAWLILITVICMASARHMG
jgi:uncharacterized membrane protein